MKKCLGWVGALLLALVAGVQAAQPFVTNVRASQRAGTKLVDIYYDLADADGHKQTVMMYVSGDSGVTYRIPALTVTGAAGSNVTVGVNKQIVWDAGRDWNGQFVDLCQVRVVANDNTAPMPPFNMVYIPPGPVQMGDNLMEIGEDARPVHTVQVAGFFMDKFEVSGALWTDVRAWGAANGYGMNAGSWSAANHPAQQLNWYDAIKWCNARSEKEGLTPVYYTDAAQITVYRADNLNISNPCVKWTANGYRLPTEAEWEKAARGALMGKRYPWGDTIGGSNANYAGSGDPFDNGTTPCGYYNGSQMPAGPDMANGYGLYDMAGNVWEWCWDWYGGSYYGTAEANDNPRGPLTGGERVLRGGSWGVNTGYLRCAYRYRIGPSYYNDYGFRCVRGR